MNGIALALPAPIQTNVEKKAAKTVEFVSFKSSPNGAYKPWHYVVPTKQTLEILKRESDANHLLQLKDYLEAKKSGAKKSLPTPHCLFCGEFVYGFQWAKGREWNVEKGWVKE